MILDRRRFIQLGALPAIGYARAEDGLATPGILKPTRLKPGDRILLVNPAGATAHRVDVEIARESFEALGLEVSLGDHLMERYGYLAGTDEQRAADINAGFADASISAIVAVRGGWGCARILPLIDFESIKRHPKVLLGYSDVTALLIAVYARTGLVTFHGPVGTGPWNEFTVGRFKRLLFTGGTETLRNPSYVGNNLTQVQHRVQTIRPGRARGRLIGGNLTILSSIMGSPYLPDFEGAILFLEDVSEEIYRIDRMLTQLKLAGVLDAISGFVFGKCTNCGPGEGYGSLTLEQVFDDHIKPLGIPAWHGAMIGHISFKFTMPEGIEVEVDADSGTIQLLESAVA